MIRFIVYLSIIAIICLAATWLFNNDGYIAMTWLGYRIEAGVAFTAISLSILMFIVISVTELTLWLKNAPGKISNDLAVHKNIKGLTSLSQGFAALIEGDMKKARDMAKTARRLIPEQPYTLLLAAEVSKELGDHDSAKKYLSDMLDHKKTEMLALRGLSGEAQNEGNFNKAIELINRARHISPKASWRSKSLIELYKKTQKWDEAKEIINLSLKQGFFQSLYSNEGKKERQKLLREKGIIDIMRAKNSYSNGRVEEALSSAKEAYNILGNFTPAVTTLATCYLALGRRGRAARIIEAAWEVEPKQELADLYLRLYQHEKMEKKIKRIEHLKSVNQDHAEGLKAIATMFLDIGADELGRQNLEDSISKAESADALKILAKLEEKEGANIEKVRILQRRAETSEPESTWVCTSCNSAHETWSAICSKCGSFDSYRWQPVSTSKVASTSGSIISVAKRIGSNG